MTLAAVAEVGNHLEQSWRRLNFERARFPDLCAEHLSAARLHQRLDPKQVVDAVMRADLPQQADPKARFGQPPVTLFRSRRFYIDVLFWVDGTTTIHDHGFSGAFQVLAGSSIETNFSFIPNRDVDGHLKFGELRVAGSALRRAGDVQAVPAGPDYIHSLFHLLRPSLSLVVRTFRDPATGSQFDYYPSGIAVDPFVEDPARERIVQVIEMMRKTDDPDLERVAGDLVADSDHNTAFWVVQALATSQDGALIEGVLNRIRDADAAARLRTWTEHRRRSDLLINRRALVKEPHLRFLLAVLLNAQNRKDALALVASHAADKDPGTQVAEWLRELSTVSMRLQIGGAPFEPNVLGLPSFAPGHDAALADLLSGRERVWTDGETAFLDRLRALPPLRPLFS